MTPLTDAAKAAAQQAADTARETAHKAGVAAKELAVDAEGLVRDVSNATRDAANRASEKAVEFYQSAAQKAEDTLATSKEYVRRNPVPVVLGAVAFGMALGYILLMSRRRPTFGERYAEEPLIAVREALLGAIAPVADGVHKGYDSARNSAEKVYDRVRGSSRSCDSISDQLGRIGNNLKFW